MSSAVRQARERGWERITRQNWHSGPRGNVAWYPSRVIGRDRPSGWYWFPRDWSQPIAGPYRTMTEAMSAAEAAHEEV